MLIRILIRGAFTVVLAIGLSIGADASAQYAQQQLSAYRFQSSASRFSAQQQYQSIITRNLSVGYSPVNQSITQQLASSYRPSSATAQPAVKPFSNASSASSGVTPYLSLSSPFSSTATNYYTQVRPQLQQQNIDRQQQVQNARFQSQLNQMAARPPYDITGSEQIAPTGHAAVFQEFLGYYPKPSRR